MSRQDLQRVEVLTEVLGVSLRQAQRLLARYRAGGGGAMIHRSRGRPASNRLGPGVQEYVLELVRQNFRDFGPTLAAEALLERHGVEVSRERRCASGWSPTVYGCRASSAEAFTSRG